MMDIEEERMAFEAWFDKQVVNAIPDANLSMQKLWALSAWQASANREGFVLVPKEPTAEICKQLSSNLDNAKLIYKAMIEAQEQSNESD